MSPLWKRAQDKIPNNVPHLFNPWHSEEEPDCEHGSSAGSKSSISLISSTENTIFLFCLYSSAAAGIWHENEQYTFEEWFALMFIFCCTFLNTLICKFSKITASVILFIDWLKILWGVHSLRLYLCDLNSIDKSDDIGWWWMKMDKHGWKSIKVDENGEQARKPRATLVWNYDWLTHWLTDEGKV